MELVRSEFKRWRCSFRFKLTFFSWHFLRALDHSPLVSTRDEERRSDFDSERVVQDIEERGNTDLMPNPFTLQSCLPHS